MIAVRPRRHVTYHIRSDYWQQQIDAARRRKRHLIYGTIASRVLAVVIAVTVITFASVRM